MILVYGGSGSGKSEYAERLIVEKQNNHMESHLFYIATMQVYDEESKKRVARHKNLRKDKGFITIEQERNISLALQKGIEKQDIVLLECLSNLVANEVFAPDVELPKDIVSFTKKLWQDLQKLAEHCEELIIVSNDIFTDGNEYDLYTKTYMEILGLLHQYIAEAAEQVIEVVYGIPIMQKN